MSAVEKRPLSASASPLSDISPESRVKGVTSRRVFSVKEQDCHSAINHFKKPLNLMIKSEITEQLREFVNSSTNPRKFMFTET